jgi:hypothetical protein
MHEKESRTRQEVRRTEVKEKKRKKEGGRKGRTGRITIFFVSSVNI